MSNEVQTEVDEEEVKRQIPGLDLMSDEGKELVAKAIKRFKWAVGFMTINDRFNYEILARLNHVPSLKIPTMGVRPTGVNIELMYNPLFVDKLTDPQLRYALSHEVLHIVLHHITKRAPQEASQHEIHNWGADLAINSLSPSTPERSYPVHMEDKVDKSTGKVVQKKGDPWILLPKQFDFPEKLSMEQYIGLLQDKYKDRCPQCGKKHDPQKGQGEEEQEQGNAPGDQDGEGQGQSQEGDGQGEGQGQGQGQGEGKGKGKGKGKGNGKGKGKGQGQSQGCGSSGSEFCDCGGVGGFDDHSGWGKSELADAQVREWVNHIESSKAWGNMSYDMQEMIRAAQKTEVKWTSVLRHYYGQITTSSLLPTYKRPSRRMWYPWSGKKRKTIDKKLVGIDDSGSVSSKMLGKFLAETNKLAEVQPVDMITWDAGLTMKKAISWDRRKKHHAFEGRGGTDPQPCLDYAKDNGYKEVIMLTDGFFSTPKAPPGLRILWVITPDGSIENLPPGGTIIKMKLMPGES